MRPAGWAARGDGKLVSRSWGLAVALVHHGKLPAISKTLVSGGGFFFCGLVTKPLLVLRKEELR